MAKKIKKIMDNAAIQAVKNGLTEAILGFNPGAPGFGGAISGVTTIFKNLRFYLVSNMRQPLSQAYVELGIVKTVVDVPVDDAMRGGIDVRSKELSSEELEELQFTVEQEDDVGTMGEGLKWDRLFGGAGVLILTDQDPATPLDIESLTPGSKLEFRAVDMWELFWDKQNIEGDGAPIDNIAFDHYRYYGMNVHRSRVLIMKGIKAPSFIRPRLRGWGVSIVEVLVRSINQYLKANDLTFEVLDEFKIDVYKIKNLANTLLDASGAELIKRRVQLANMQKNYQNAITMDSEDDFTQKELSFQGIAETMTGIRMQVASDLRMPLSKVFGISAQGFSSGEDDIENYNAMVESTIRQKCKHHFITMMKLRCQNLFGYVPDDLTVDFKPLRILSSEQQENVKNAQYERLVIALDKGVVDSKEFKEACNKDKLLPLQLDTEKELVEPPQSSEGDGAELKSISKKSETQAPMAKNSLDKEIQNPGNVDEALWEKAKKKSQEEYGHIKYAFVMYLYKEMGGK